MKEMRRIKKMVIAAMMLTLIANIFFIVGCSTQQDANETDDAVPSDKNLLIKEHQELSAYLDSEEVNSKAEIADGLKNVLDNINMNNANEYTETIDAILERCDKTLAYEPIPEQAQAYHDCLAEMVSYWKQAANFLLTAATATDSNQFYDLRESAAECYQDGINMWDTFRARELEVTNALNKLGIKLVE